MNSRRVILFLSLAALMMGPGVRAQPRPELPALPGSKPTTPEPAPAVVERKSSSPAAAAAPAPAPETTEHEAEKGPAAPAAPKPKSTKSIFTLPTVNPVKTFTPPPLSPRFLQVRAKIETLFAIRNTPPAPPDARLNPFRPPGAIPVAPLATKDGVIEPVAVNNNLALLQQAVAAIRVKGTVSRGKILQLVINTGPGKEGTYKEGDIINVSLAPDPVHLKVRVITRNSVTFTLSDAEMVLKF